MGKKMNICLVGDFSENLDEGYKNTCHYLARELEVYHNIYRVNIKHLKRTAFWRNLARIKPDIVHTIAQPTHGSLVFTHLFGHFWRKAPTIVSALRPDNYFKGGEMTRLQRQIIRATKPSVVMVQTSRAESLFRAAGCTTVRTPNGVDLQKFKPVTPQQKRELKSKYGFNPLEPVVLHVGHLESNRNLLALTDLPPAGIQVAVAGSLYRGIHSDLINQLEEAGFHLFKGYQPNVAELYRMSDCYVFPPKPGDSLTMPLSVLEAMACNLPVVTTRFTGLEDAFQESHGFKFARHNQSFLPYVQAMLAASTPLSTRCMVEPYSWSAIAKKLMACYEELLQS